MRSIRKILQLEMESSYWAESGPRGKPPQKGAAGGGSSGKLGRGKAPFGGGPGKTAKEKSGLNAQWQKEKGAIMPSRPRRSSVSCGGRLKAQLRPQPGAAPSLEYGTLGTLKQEAARPKEAALNAETAKKNLLREEVTLGRHRRGDRQWTAIPVARLVQSEMESCCISKPELHNPGDRPAAGGHGGGENALQRSRAGLSDPNRPPIASFLFLGTHGRGQDELCPKALAAQMFDSERSQWCAST